MALLCLVRLQRVAIVPIEYYEVPPLKVNESAGLGGVL